MSDAPRLEGTRIERLAAQPTLAVRIRQSMDQEGLSAAFDRYLPMVGIRAREIGVTLAGPPYGRYHLYGPEVVDLEIGIPVAAVPEGIAPLGPGATGELGASELPACLVARTTHLGPYRTLPGAYEALHEWIHEQPGIDDGDGPWESYMNLPGETDPADLRTEIIWPLREGD